ncbi:uncharacterized protein LOC130799321 [Amaranthus tricolor]|uniref:uncharacterized protein LOC130799321 n=1 Tax=Amaranthus tricolor TaxID=29722 RepID=UPI00258C9153|nr:uncharacterized protein LOC130799321 [Amaranthus tricolor]
MGESEVTIGGEVVACTSKFKYLGSMIQSNREIYGDTTNRIQAECWPVKKVLKQMIEVSKMRVLRWMGGNTTMDRIRKPGVQGEVMSCTFLRKDAGEPVEIVWACADKET